MQTLRHNHIIAILFSCYSSLVLHVVTLMHSRVGPTWTVTRSCVSDSLSVSVTRHFAAESRRSMSLSNGCSGHYLQLKKFINANF